MKVFLRSAMVAASFVLVATIRAEPPAVDEIDPHEAASFLDSKVSQQDKKVIGRTVNVVIEGGTPQRAIIDLNGFMGVGNHTAVVPWNALRFDPSADGAKVTLDLSQDQIRTMAKVKPSAPPPTIAPPQTEPQVAATPPAAPEPGLKLIDATLNDTQGKALGTVTDVLVDQAAQPRAVIVDFGGTLELKGREIAVSWRAIHFGQIKGKPSVTADITHDQAKAASDYKSGQRADAILSATTTP